MNSVSVYNLIDEILSFYNPPFTPKVVELVQRVVSGHLRAEGISPDGYPELIQRILSTPGAYTIELLKKEELFVLWDALGCDDENVRSISTEVEAIYLMLGRAWLRQNGWDIELKNYLSGNDINLFYRLFNTAKSLGHRPVENF